ncbi:MAG: DEAD/DEAH box helicase, partial [Chloroflexota bacterium]
MGGSTGGGSTGRVASLVLWGLPALTLDAARASDLLLAVSEPEEAGGVARTSGVTLGSDLRFWIAAARFARDKLYRWRPPESMRSRGGTLARWRWLMDEESRQWSALLGSLPPAHRALRWTEDAPQLYPHPLLNSYLGTLRAAITQQGPVPSRAGGHPADAFRVCFRLTPPLNVSSPPRRSPFPSREGGQGGRSSWTLEYLLQATDDPSLLISAADWRREGFLTWALSRRHVDPQRGLLNGLRRASTLCSPIRASLLEARPEACSLSPEEALQFILQTAKRLQASGFGVLVPGSLALDTKLAIRVRLGDVGQSPDERRDGLGFLTRDRVVRFDWQVALGDETLSREEFETLASLKQPLVRVRGRWIELQPNQVAQVLDLVQRHGAEGSGGEIPLPQALRLALTPHQDAGPLAPEVETRGWLHGLLQSLSQAQQGAQRETVDEPEGFAGQLRPYQKAGVAWLAALRRAGLGACLADDMGLGKTIELIALLLHQPQPEVLEVAPPERGDAENAQGPENAEDCQPPYRPGERHPTLLICPTSVVGNWRRELARFAPSLRVLVHHGAGRNRHYRETFAYEAAGHDVVLSTYALLHRDEALLASVPWQDVVLDEAQNIKNASTKAAQVARRLPARWRAALTGTPVENRL